VERVSLLCRNSLLSATTTSNQASLSTKTATLDLSDWFPQQQQQQEEGTILVSVRTRRWPSLLKDNKEDTTSNYEETIDPVILESVTKPFVRKSIWSRLKGNEYDQPGVIDDLVETALFMTKLEDSEWIKWEAQQKEDSSSDMMMETDLVRVHVGRCKKADADQYYSANLPLIRTEARLPNITPKDMADLLLDSSRVEIYNKMSLGRRDVQSVECS